jgi:3-oxoadipate enol-lactonase
VTFPVQGIVGGPSEGEAVVLSPSLGSNHTMWQEQRRALEAHGFRTVAYDHRGHGGALVPPGPYTIADLGGDVVALLDSLEIERAHFVGLSLGGMTGMWLAANAPGRVGSLALCCTSAKLGPPEGWADRARAVRANGTGSVADAVISRWLTPAHAKRFPEQIASLRQMFADIPDEGYAACCGAIERMDLTGDLPKITAPTLVIAGAEDPATPPEDGQRIAELIPDARLEIVENAAHLGNLEQPAKFTQLILDHLKGAP